MERRNLVFVRAGAHSLHPRLLAGGDARSWDILVSYYDAAAFAAGPTPPADGVAVEYVPGGKWKGVYQAFNQVGRLDQYDYVWFPDDDVAATPEAVEAIFRVARERELAVCQPALTLDSYYSHWITLVQEGFQLRYTDFVEIMAPCLRRDTILRALPLFDRTESGFGLNHLWQRLDTDNRRQAAIIDAVTVRHTRPVSTREARVKANGVDAVEEGRDLLRPFGIPTKVRAVAYAGIASDGTPIDGQLRIAAKMAATHLRRGRNRTPLKHVVRMLRDHLRETPKLSPLTVPLS
jgi:hypothetical protein